MRATDVTGTVYLLHFERPISPHHTCQHYLGFAGDLAVRLQEHAAGRGARLTQVALERGIGWRLVRTWEGGRGRTSAGGSVRRTLRPDCVSCVGRGGGGDEGL